MGRRNKEKIYTIILVNHGKQLKRLRSEKTEALIYRRFNKMLEENKNVVFPVKYNNHEHVMVESEYELVIIKCKQENDNDVNKVRNKYGKFVDYATDDEDWIVVDRAPYDIEETFWIYGYHPRLQRKDFNWIYENFIKKDSNNKYSIKTIILYLNKLLVECNGKLDMVICKNRSDGIRLYNQLQEYSIRDKLKYNLFMGNLEGSRYKPDWIERIQQLTHWSKTKIIRSSTRP